jgi:uncharacterized protein YraI
MTFKSKLLGAGAALLISTGAALAVPAIAETDLNVRSGPGPEFPVVGAIPAGQTVDVGNCTGSWCRVNFAGGAGFASRSYLQIAGGPGVAVAPGYAYAPRYAYDDDDYYAYGYGYGPSVGIYAGSYYGYGYGGRRDGWRGGTAWQGRTGSWQGRSGNWQGRTGWNGNRSAGGNWQGRSGGARFGSAGGGNRMGSAGGTRMGSAGGGMSQPGSVSPQTSAPAAMPSGGGAGGGGASVGAGGGGAGAAGGGYAGGGASNPRR